MKLSHLLAASSVAALLAGAAHAAVGIQHTAGGTVAPGYKIADEVNFTALATANKDDGTYIIEIGTDGTIPPGQNLFLTITVANGKFTTNLNGSEFVGAPSGVTGAVVNSGGLANGSTVRYLITTDGVATAGTDPDGVGPLLAKADRVRLQLPIDIVGCAPLSFSVTEFQTESGGTPIEGGAATMAVPSVTCVSAFSASIVPDSDTTTISSATGFEEFLVDLPDSAATAVVGEAEFAVDTSVHIDMDGTDAAPAHVLGFTASVDFEDGDNIVSANAVAVTGTLFDATAVTVGDSAALVGTPDATLVAETGTITIDAETGTPGPMAAQEVTVSGANLTLNTALQLKATDAFTSADVQDLIYDGQTFGPFDWVADTNGATNNIFRMTGLGTVDVPAQLILENSNEGVNDTFPFTILASEINNGEYRLNRQKIEAVVGEAYGTADVTIVLSTPESVDIDRLIATTATGAVVSNFGDGSNQDGPADGVDQP